MNLRGALAALALVSIGAGDCWAWGATGHEWISGIAIEKLPDSMPTFVRTPEAAAEIAVMGRELDRSKGAGKIHDAERDPGHYVDLGDNREVMSVLPLAKLPPTREAYDTELRAKGYTQYKAGYLPYSIVAAGTYRATRESARLAHGALRVRQHPWQVLHAHVRRRDLACVPKCAGRSWSPLSGSALTLPRSRGVVTRRSGVRREGLPTRPRRPPETLPYRPCGI
jgi:hypothetical protein